MIIKVLKCHENAVVPSKIDGNLGFDLHVVRDGGFWQNVSDDRDPESDGIMTYFLLPKSRHLFHTGLKFKIADGYGLLLKDRSGLATKHGIHVLAGVIDSSFLGEVCICLINLGEKTYEIHEGDRIAQAIIVKDEYVNFLEVKELGQTDRGEKGFGSSGK